MTMESKTVLVTGAASGLGQITAVELAKKGAHVVLVARSEERAAPTADLIAKAGHKAEIAPMDLASGESIQKGADKLREKHEKLDVLINNAGVWAGKRTETPEGFETSWSVNVLAPFRLTHLLQDPLKAGEGKVVNLSSVQHYKGDIHWDDLQLKKSYSGAKAYRQSKLAVTMLSAEHAQRDDALKVNSVHPGVAGTELFRNFPAFIRFWINLLMSSPEKVAQPPIMLASDPAHAEATGRFFHKHKPKQPHRLVEDSEARERLWDVVSKHAGA